MTVLAALLGPQAPPDDPNALRVALTHRGRRVELFAGRSTTRAALAEAAAKEVAEQLRSADPDRFATLAVESNLCELCRARPGNCLLKRGGRSLMVCVECAAGGDQP